MKEVMLTAAKYITSVFDDLTMRVQVEGVIVVSEPAYRIDAGGCLVKERVNECLRFTTDIKGMKTMIANMETWVADMEKIEAKLPKSKKKGKELFDESTQVPEPSA